MKHGRPDRILRVNLSTEAVTSEPVPDRWLRQYIGGKGLGARYLYEELDAGTNPLGPDNVLLFMLGPLSGLLPGDARYAAVTKSPLTGTFLDSYSGGEFAAHLAGALDQHLGLLVTGRAEEPTAIVVEDGSATLTTVTDLEGTDTIETSEEFPDARVACVGPAGENRVRYATIASDRGQHHAGRGGTGAVMGSKRLKAVVVRGEPPTALADLREEYEAEYLDDDVGRWHEASETLETVDFANEVGVLPTRGWQEGVFEDADEIGISAARESSVGRENDEGTVPGGFRVETEDGEYVPRGATAMSLGAGLGVDEFDAVATLGQACDRLGMDVISAGNTVAWAVRASNEGHVDRELSFGDDDAALSLIEEIATREGSLGDALADGVEAAAERHGGEELVPTVKSMESPAYDPRGAKGMALAYATSDRGACHRRALPVEVEVFEREEWTDDDRVRAVVRAQDVNSVLWSLVADDFSGNVLTDDLGAEWLAAVGLDYDPEELLAVGERIWTLVRLFNVREGFDSENDSLPSVFTEPLTGGPADGQAVDQEAFEALLQRYYAERDWSEEGFPTQSLLDRLGLSDVVDNRTPVARDSARVTE